MNPRSAPCGILGHHAEDQLSQVFVGCLPSEGLSMAREPSPVQAESSPMPADHRLRAHDFEGLLPLGPEPFDEHPEESIQWIQRRLGLASLQNKELLAKGEIF